MSTYVPSENELVVNPITGGVVLGKNTGKFTYLKFYCTNLCLLC